MSYHPPYHYPHYPAPHGYQPAYPPQAAAHSQFPPAASAPAQIHLGSPSPAPAPRPVDHSLNEISLEYTYADLRESTNNFDEKCKLGHGAYGCVFKGVLKDGTEVAIKVLQIPKEAGFEEEVKVLSKFRHPNLVILMGFARNGAQRLLVYEMLPGGDVSNRLASGPTLSWKRRLTILLDAACGLSHLHNAKPKVFHRDIKTANILLDRNGTAKMADFGLACLMQAAHDPNGTSGSSSSQSYKVQQTAGTIGYADPLYIKRALVNEKTEVYSFGMVILELLTAKPPAVQKSNGGIEYLAHSIGRDVGLVMGLLDPNAKWHAGFAHQLAVTAFECIQDIESARPDFKTLVQRIRKMVNESDSHPDPEVRPHTHISPALLPDELQRAKQVAHQFQIRQQQQQQAAAASHSPPPVAGQRRQQGGVSSSREDPAASSPAGYGHQPQQQPVQVHQQTAHGGRQIDHPHPNAHAGAAPAAVYRSHTPDVYGGARTESPDGYAYYQAQARSPHPADDSPSQQQGPVQAHQQNHAGGIQHINAGVSVAPAQLLNKSQGQALQAGGQHPQVAAYAQQQSPTGMQMQMQQQQSQAVGAQAAYAAQSHYVQQQQHPHPRSRQAAAVGEQVPSVHGAAAPTAAPTQSTHPHQQAAAYSQAAYAGRSLHPHHAQTQPAAARQASPAASPGAASAPPQRGPGRAPAAGRQPGPGSISHSRGAVAGSPRSEGSGDPAGRGGNPNVEIEESWYGGDPDDDESGEDEYYNDDDPEYLEHMARALDESKRLEEERLRTLRIKEEEEFRLAVQNSESTAAGGRVDRGGGGGGQRGSSGGGLSSASGGSFPATAAIPPGHYYAGAGPCTALGPGGGDNAVIAYSQQQPAARQQPPGGAYGVVGGGGASAVCAAPLPPQQQGGGGGGGGGGG